MSDAAWTPFEPVVPVFPLPNLVMFPRAVQFLHVFEPRYKEMTDNILAQAEPEAPGLLAMALLKGDYQEKYYTNHAAIHQTLCLCEILRHERLDDGRYNLLVRGQDRARIRSEDRHGSYRRAELDLLGDLAAIDEPMTAGEKRTTLGEILRQTPFDTMPEGERCLEWVASDMPLSDVADLVAFHMLPQDEVELRQSVLRECIVDRRVDALVGHLDTLGRIVEAHRRRYQSWPPEPGTN